MAGAAAGSIPRRLHARGDPADRVLPLKPVARAPLRRPPRRKPYRRPSVTHVPQHAVRRALKLLLLPEMAGAAADGTHRHLRARGGPADGVLPLKLARACVA